MAEDDIYGSKGRYENFKTRLKELLLVPTQRSIIPVKGGYAKYYCKNPANLRYFEHLFAHLEAKDSSYIRRLRVLNCLQLVMFVCEKDFCECKREDLNKVLAYMHSTHNSPRGKETFIKDLKYVWKTLFPSIDENGWTDDTIYPYAVRHLSAKIDKSRQKTRKDKLTLEEVSKIIDYFGKDTRIQAYITLALESLARPQELLYLRLCNVELFDNYAKIWLTEHGKEGTGLLQCIDSFPSLLKWIGMHPLKADPNSFLFINTGNSSTLKQLKPSNINNMLHKACRALSIDKPVTCYSLKRNGVTIRRLRGESDMEIMHAARWTSTQQLKVYDLSNQEDAFKRELTKRGLITETNTNSSLGTKKCGFCGKIVAASEAVCPSCNRPLNRRAIMEEMRQKEELQAKVDELSNQIMAVQQQMLEGMAKQLPQTPNPKQTP